MLEIIRDKIKDNKMLRTLVVGIIIGIAAMLGIDLIDRGEVVVDAIVPIITDIIPSD